jgi:hypothetical protein
MKNGYTPRQYAYALAIDGLSEAFNSRFGELENLPHAEVEKVRLAIIKLKAELAEKGKLDVS